MKKIKFTCTNCDAKLRVPTHLAGVSAPCPRCGATITAPTDIANAFDDELEPRRAVSSGAVRSSRQELSGASSGKPRVISGAVSTATSILPRSATTSEVPTPVSRPLQSRPLVQPATAELSAPVFYSPPPPERSITPVPPESDARSEAPVSLPPLPPVVVETSTFPVTDPAPRIPVITQPIQLNSRPGGLVENLSAVSGADPLPRLDVSLAGQDLSAAAALLFPEAGSQPVRTRVQLPQPGVETHNFSPDDFIVPVAPPVFSPAATMTPPPLVDTIAAPDFEDRHSQEAQYREIMLPIEAVEALPQPHYTSIPLPPEMPPIPLEDVDFASFDELPEQYGGGESAFADGNLSFQETPFPDQEGLESSVPGLDLPQWEEDELAGGHEPPLAAEALWDLQPKVTISQSIAPQPLPDDWRRGKTQPVPPLEQPVTRVAEEVDFFQEVPAAPLQQGSFGKLFSQQSDHPERAGDLPAAISGDQDEEVDVLERLFGDRPRGRAESKGLSKTAIMMISCLIGAGILASVVVFFFFESFGGGFDVAESYGTDDEAVQPKPKPADTTAAEPSLADVPAIIDPVALIRESAGNNPDTRGAAMAPAGGVPAEAAAPVGAEAPALSFDERVQQVVNGTDKLNEAGAGASVGRPQSPNVVDDAINRFNGSIAPGGVTPLVAPALQSSTVSQEPAAVAAPPLTAGPGAAPAQSPPAAITPAAGASSAPAAKGSNYNPAAVFPAPGPNETPLSRTNDVMDAFLRAPNAQARLKYTFQGASLQAAIEDYYKKWPDKPIERYSLQLFQMEQSAERGGPYWVYLVSTSDMDQGFPLIVRVEEGNLKVDWEIYSEFYDRHFVRYREHKLPSPANFRVVIERVTDYYGSDLKDFKTLKDYQVYQVNPPYGDLNEFSEYAFVKKDSELAKKFEKVVGLGDEPLAVIVTLDEKAFEHGVKHYVITDYLTEGWFR